MQVFIRPQKILGSFYRNIDVENQRSPQENDLVCLREGNTPGSIQISGTLAPHPLAQAASPAHAAHAAHAAPAMTSFTSADRLTRRHEIGSLAIYVWLATVICWGPTMNMSANQLVNNCIDD